MIERKVLIKNRDGETVSKKIFKAETNEHLKHKIECYIRSLRLEYDDFTLFADYE